MFRVSVIPTILCSFALMRGREFYDLRRRAKLIEDILDVPSFKVKKVSPIADYDRTRFSKVAEEQHPYSGYDACCQSQNHNLHAGKIMLQKPRIPAF